MFGGTESNKVENTMSLDAFKGYNIPCVWVKDDENSEKESTSATGQGGEHHCSITALISAQQQGAQLYQSLNQVICLFFSSQNYI